MNNEPTAGFRPESYQQYLIIWARTCLWKVDHLRAVMDSMDLVQETLCQAHASLEDFRGTTEREFTAWLRQILQNRMWDLKKHHERGKRDVRKNDALYQTLNETSVNFANRFDKLVSPLLSPTKALGQNESVRRIADALAKLPEAQRTALVLHHVDDRSLEETAKAMNRSTASVAGLLRRGLHSLRNTLCLL